MMVDAGPWLLLGLSLAALLVLSAFFSGAETALFSLNRIQLSRMKESRDRASARILTVLGTPNRLLTSVLIGNTLVNVSTAAVATTFLLRLSHRWGLELAVVLDTALVLIFGEILPKTMAVSFPERVARTVVRPLQFFMTLASPMAKVVVAISRRMLRLLGVQDTSLKLDHLTHRELRSLFDELEREEVMSELETRMTRNIFSFSTTPAQSVMTPRVDVVAVSASAPVDEIVKTIKESRHSRIPVYSDGIDNTVGFINAKEFLLDPTRPISSYVRPVMVVPEKKRIDEIFQEMQSKQFPMVVVVNEYGEMVGIVTQEDLVEQVVGEIYDEYEVEEAPVAKEAEGEFVVEGLISLEDLNRELDLDLRAEESVTLNGLLCEKLERLPAQGDVVKINGVTLEVLEVQQNRCERCRVKIELERQGS
jgi:putative hemolysin